MCFGPTAEEKEAALRQREEAEAEKRAAILERAKQKREDISVALEGRVARRGFGGGSGRRSLMTGSSSGYASRF